MLAGLGVLICIFVAAQADTKAWLTLLALSAVGLGLYFAAAVGKEKVRS